MTPVAKLNILKSLVQHNALNDVNNTLELFAKATELKDIHDFHNPETRSALRDCAILRKTRNNTLRETYTRTQEHVI